MFKKTKDLYEVLRGENYGSREFRKAVQKAYVDYRWEKSYIKSSKMIKFQNGSGRIVNIPADIVEDIIGTEPDCFAA